MGDSTNVRKGSTDVPRRESARSRKQVDFGLQLVAQGQRSPKGRRYVMFSAAHICYVILKIRLHRAAWEYDSSQDVENRGPTKRARLD